MAEARKSVRLKLVGSKSNRDGLGATLVATLADKALMHQHFTARSYLSSLDPVVTIGLGSSDKLSKLDITWPSGKKQTLTDIPAGKVVEVKEPE